MDFIECQICFEYKTLLKASCCNFVMCNECHNKWSKGNSKIECPPPMAAGFTSLLCRKVSQNKEWTDLKNNLGSIITTIIDTLLKNGVDSVVVQKEEYDIIKNYFKDYKQKQTDIKKDDKCWCTNSYPHSYYQAAVINLKEKVCNVQSVCVACYYGTRPDRLWELMINNKNTSNRNNVHKKVGSLRDSIMAYNKTVKSKNGVKVRDWNRIENILKVNGWLQTYIDEIQYRHIINIIDISLADNRYNSIEYEENYGIRLMLFKYLKSPTNDISHTTLSKIFFEPAWKLSTKYKGFVGLWPMINLWNIIRGNSSQYIDSWDGHTKCFNFFMEWKNQLEGELAQVHHITKAGKCKLMGCVRYILLEENWCKLHFNMCGSSKCENRIKYKDKFCTDHISRCNWKYCQNRISFDVDMCTEHQTSQTSETSE